MSRRDEMLGDIDHFVFEGYPDDDEPAKPANDLAERFRRAQYSRLRYVEAEAQELATRLQRARYALGAFDESKHPRGQPENAGEFAKGSGQKPTGSQDSSKPDTGKPPEQQPAQPEPAPSQPAMPKGGSGGGTLSKADPSLPAPPPYTGVPLIMPAGNAPSQPAAAPAASATQAASQRNMGAAALATKAAAEKHEQVKQVAREAHEQVAQSQALDMDPQDLARFDATLQEPKTAADVDGMIDAFNQHPHVKEVRRRLIAAAKEIGGDETNFEETSCDYSRRMHTGPDGKYTPEAQARHQEIADKMLPPETKAKPGERPQMVVLIGAPGSGKTSAGQPFIKKLGVEFAAINNDTIKEGLGGYEGWNAALFHNEASDVMDQDVVPRGFRDRHNMIFDITGRGYASAEEWIKEAAARGYDCHVVHVKVEPKTSAFRTGRRFLENSFSRNKDAEPGRFVPLDYALHGVDGKPDGTYARLKANPDVKSWVQLSNDVPRGADPIVLDHGERQTQGRFL